MPGETCFWQTVINYVGVPDFINHRPELVQAAPITYVTGNFPPAYILVSSNDASQLGIHDFPQLLAKFNSVGITESTARYPEAGHYKQWIVPVGESKHIVQVLASGQVVSDSLVASRCSKAIHSRPPHRRSCFPHQLWIGWAVDFRHFRCGPREADSRLLTL